MDDGLSSSKPKTFRATRPFEGSLEKMESAPVQDNLRPRDENTWKLYELVMFVADVRCKVLVQLNVKTEIRPRQQKGKHCGRFGDVAVVIDSCTFFVGESVLTHVAQPSPSQCMREQGGVVARLDTALRKSTV